MDAKPLQNLQAPLLFSCTNFPFPFPFSVFVLLIDSKCKHGRSMLLNSCNFISLARYFSKKI